MTSRVEELARKVVDEIVRAHKAIAEVLGVELTEKHLENALSEAEHIVIHEMVHQATLMARPELEEIWRSNPRLAECILELGGRILERIVSERIGAYVHSFEEHVHELKHYSLLRDVDIDASYLEDLYRRVVELLRTKDLKQVIEFIESRCRELVERGGR